VRLELTSNPVGVRLGACYQQVPLRVLPPFSFGPGEPGLLFLLSPTAGLFDGDAHLIDLTVTAGVRAVVAGQSATRLHPALVSFSTQQWRLRVGAGAVLVVLPGPVIPFRGCRTYQRVSADLEPGAALVWADVWLAGRYARAAESERFAFDQLVQEVEVRRNGERVFRDRFAWRGPWDDAAAHWHFGGRIACGSLLIAGKLPTSGLPDLAGSGAALRTAAGDVCVRWCGPAEVVIEAVVDAALRAGALLADGVGRWLGPDVLAPCHWFTGHHTGKR
jgi:urease accessory protein